MFSSFLIKCDINIFWNTSGLFTLIFRRRGKVLAAQWDLCDLFPPHEPNPHSCQISWFQEEKDFFPHQLSSLASKYHKAIRSPRKKKHQSTGHKQKCNNMWTDRCQDIDCPLLVELRITLKSTVVKPFRLD